MQAAPLWAPGHYAPDTEQIAPPAPQQQPGWGLDALAGRFVELCGGRDSGVLSVSAGLVVQAQQRGGLAAWVSLPGSIFFPPDFAASGVDLAALPLVRVPDAMAAAHAADQLLRSGAFALVTVDLNTPRISRPGLCLPLPVQTRLAGLAKKHDTALVMITQSDAREQQAGSLVSLRAEAHKRRAGDDLFYATLRAMKDKRQSPGWGYEEVYRGPKGWR